MKYIKISIGIFLALAASRLFHTTKFYKFNSIEFLCSCFAWSQILPALIICFIFTDLIIGLHEIILFTWGSIIVIGLISNRFIKNIFYRITGAVIGALIFYIITNFGVWSLGSYGYSLSGLILCYTLALPFFGYTMISTIIFSVIIEAILKLKLIKILKF